MLNFSQFLPYNFISGCLVTVDPVAHTPVISTGFVRDDSNSVDIVINTPLTLYGQINGANGLDTGTLQTSKVYAVYVISDPTGMVNPAGLISLTMPSDPLYPVMPSVNGVTYTVKRLVGFLRTPSSFSSFNFS